MPRLMFLRRLIPVLLALIVVAAGFFFYTRPKPVTVDWLTLHPADVQTSVVASGRVLSPAKVELGVTLTARVAHVRVREGARVAAGEVLIELERGELAAALAQARAALSRARARVASVKTLALPTAEANLSQARANLTMAQQEAQRARDLFAKGFVSQARVDEAQRQLDVANSQIAGAQSQTAAQSANGAEAQQAQSQLVEAEAALAAAAARLAQTQIRAPGAGVILDRVIEPGDIAQPGRRMMSLALDGPVRLIVQVDEKNLPLIRHGAVATAAADAFPNERFEAVVNYVSPGVDPARGSVELRLDVPRPPALLKADMTIAMDLQGPLLKQALMLPADAVRQLQTDAPWVLVEREGKAVKTMIRTGLQTQGRVAVVEGLKAGDRVIMNRDVEVDARVRARQ